MKDILQDIVSHTQNLGFLTTVKVTGTENRTTINSMADIEVLTITKQGFEEESGESAIAQNLGTVPNLKTEKTGGGERRTEMTIKRVNFT